MDVVIAVDTGVDATVCVVGSVQCDGSQPQVCDAVGQWLNDGPACPPPGPPFGSHVEVRLPGTDCSGGGGGGTGLLGIGANGAGGTTACGGVGTAGGGGGGSGGRQGGAATGGNDGPAGNGAHFGGGGGGGPADSGGVAGNGGKGGVRVVWGPGTSYPSNAM